MERETYCEASLKGFASRHRRARGARGVHFLCTHRRARWRIAVCIALQATLVSRPGSELSTVGRTVGLAEAVRTRLLEHYGPRIAHQLDFHVHGEPTVRRQRVEQS